MDSRIILQLVIYFMIGLACAKQLSRDIEHAVFNFRHQLYLSEYDKYLLSIDSIHKGCSKINGFLFMLGLYVLTIILCPVWFVIKIRNI